MKSSEKSLILYYKFNTFLFSKIFLLITINLYYPILTSNNYIIHKKNEISIYNNHLENISNCFNIINETTIEKKSFFYSKTFSTELCLKIAISQKYKEDIYYPKYFHKCFPLCNSCSSYSTKLSDMKCISCLKGFIIDNNGNCYINKKYNENIRKKELSTIFNTLNTYNYKNINYTKKYIDGMTYLFKEKKATNNKRKLYKLDDYDDYSNNIINRETQTSLTNDKTNCEYNFHIELSPYYILAEICISKGKNYIENDRCVDTCTPQLETYFNYPVVEIKVGPSDRITVCDCAFRCCKKKINNLYKSLDRGYIDGSYQYFRRQDGFCLYYEEGNYYDRERKNTYLLAQDFVPCFFPIYDDNDEIEFYISGYGKTIVGNDCLNRCPDDIEIGHYYYYNPMNSGCYKCPENCIECNNIPTNENGYCIRCTEGFNVIYNGFCYDICPNQYGDDNGFCRQCRSNEILIEGKCVAYISDTYNYGNSTNPSFIDPYDNKIFHKCIEFIGNKTYIIAKNEPICQSLETLSCPNFCYDGEDGFCYECSKGCKSCYLNSDKKESCFECKEDYIRKSDYSCEEKICNFFIQGSSTCYSNCPDGYFYVKSEDEPNKYQCITSCKNDQYDLFNTITRECKLRCLGDDATIIEPENLCLEECNDNYPENIEGTCVNCALNSEFNNNGTCVIADEHFDELYYILPGPENEKYNKVGSCYLIDKLGDYHPEHILSREYNPSLCPNDCPSHFVKKYDENHQIYCLKCYDTCDNCEHTGVSGNHKCTQCKDGYEFSNRMYGVCDEICDNGDFFYYSKTREKKCVNKCPDDFPFLAENEDNSINNYECIANCTHNNQFLINETFTCTKECPDGYNKFGILCVQTCPLLYGSYLDSNECIPCKNNSLLYYNGRCYKIEIEIPLDTYLPDTQKEDKILYDCFQEKEGEEDVILTGYFAETNNCSKICPEDYYYDNVDRVCKKCPSDCVYCDPISGCIHGICPNNYYSVLDEEGSIIKCVTSCPCESPIINEDNSCLEACEGSQVKILVSGDENLGTANYICSDDKCKDHNLLLQPSSKTCYQPYNIPNETFYNPDTQTVNENKLDPCFTKINDNEYFTGFFFAISKCTNKCPDYYYYADNNKCKKCYFLCKTCFGEGNYNENKCLSCNDTENRLLNPYLFNCEKKCEGSFHYSEETKEIVCDEECPKNSYIDKDTGKCITKCEKLIENNYCVNECSEGKNEFNGYCLENVTIPVIIITKSVISPNDNTNDPPISSSSVEPIDNHNTDTDFIPKENQKDDNFEKDNEISYNQEINKIIKVMERNISNYIHSTEDNSISNSNIISTVNGNISLCIIYMNESIIKCGNSNNKLYLNECQQKIKGHYTTENAFYLMQIDLNDKKSIKNEFSSHTKYKMYLLNGDEIDINDICKELEVKVEKNIKLSKKLENNNELMSRMLEEGINVYDKNDPFFNDKCYPYTDEHGNDVPLENRKEDYYQNTIYCIDGCEYNNINVNTSNIICNCKIDSLTVKKDEEDKSILGYLDDNKYDKEISSNSHSTIDVVQCYEKTFEKENIKKNVGFWIYAGIILLSLLLLGGLLCFGYNALNSYLLEFADGKQIEKNEEELENEEEEEEVTKKVVVSSYENMNSNENINTNENKYSYEMESSNPPKKTKNANDDSFSEEKTRTRTRTRKKISYGYDKNKTSTEYPNLSISKFGNGYKLSNRLEEENLEEDFQSPTKLSEKRYEEYEKSNGNGSEIVRYNSRQTSNSLIHSFSNSGRIENKRTLKNNYVSHVELEPDGALLAASNFFDTCRIVKLGKDFSEVDEENYETKIKKSKLKSNINNSNYNTLKKNNNFYQADNKIVKLPGFPDPHYEKKESIIEEEERYKKNFNRETDNPLNRYYNNNYDYSNELEEIDEKYDELTLRDNRQTQNENSLKNRKKLYKNRNSINKTSIRTDEENFDIESLNVQDPMYYKYNRHNIRSSIPKYKRNSYINTTSSRNLSEHPVTINKYYFTNNKNDDNYKERIIREEKQSIDEYKKRGRNKKEFKREDSENNYYEEEEEKRNKGKMSNNKNNRNNRNNNRSIGEKVITYTNKKKRNKNGKKTMYSKKDILINDLDIASFEEVMNDNRSFCGIYCSFLSNYQIFISICFSTNIFVPWILRALIGLFTLELFFTFTALLMTSTQFEKRYKYQNDIDIIYILQNEYLNIIYTILIAKVMNFISLYLFNNYQIIKVIRDYAYQGKIFISELNKALYRLKCKYYFFSIIFIILSCLQGYFISCFCTVYVGSIKPWIYSALIAFVLSLLVSFIFLFLSAMFRIIAISCISWLFFIFSYIFLFLS